MQVRTLRTFVLFALFAPSWEARAQEDPAALETRIADLIGQLADSAYETREAATERLIEIGEPALQALDAAAGDPDPEVRQRALVILAEIPRRFAYYESRGKDARAQLLRQEGGDGTQEAVDRALWWLECHQEKRAGRWDSDDFQERCKKNTCSGRGAAWCDPGQTGLALLAFLTAGHTHRDGRYSETVKGGLRFLGSAQEPDGCFGPREGHFMYNHAIGTLAMVEAYGMTKSSLLLEPAERGVEFLLRARNPGFAWRYAVQPGDSDTSVTGWAFLALQSARAAGIPVSAEAYEGARSWLDAVTDPRYFRTGYMQNSDPGCRFSGPEVFSPTETCTAISVASRLWMGTPRGDALLEGQGDLLSQGLPSWDTNGGPGGTSRIDFYYWHHGSLAMFQLGGNRWRIWNRAMRNAILDNQRTDDGDELGSWDPIDAWSPEGGRIYATAINALTLQVYYRYPRVRD